MAVINQISLYKKLLFFVITSLYTIKGSNKLVKFDLEVNET